MPTKFRVEITKTAEKDVDEIWNFIAQDNPQTATDFILKLEKHALTLERFPRRCPLIPEGTIVEREYRHLLFDPYRIIFRIEGKEVYVMRIFHTARLLDSSILEDILE